MLYSVKMRSAQGGAHEFGGRHISGAERILPGDQLDYAVLTMLHRAREHERGCADFISLKVEEIKAHAKRQRRQKDTGLPLMNWCVPV